MTLLEAMRDPNLFARWFRDPETWSAWTAFIAALFALPMSHAQLQTYRQCTGRTTPPAAPVSEGWLVCGRRAGKSFILALIAVFLAAFHDYRRYLAPGERATILVLATNIKQARTIFRYIRALLTRVPMLARMIERADGRRVRPEQRCHHRNSRLHRTGAFVATRSSPRCATRSHSGRPTMPPSPTMKCSMRCVPPWRRYRMRCCSVPARPTPDAVRCTMRIGGTSASMVTRFWCGSRQRRTMNPTVPQAVIDAAMERDPAYAAAEYGAEFRTDVETFVLREAAEACVIARRARAAAAAQRHLSRFRGPLRRLRRIR